MKTGDEKTGDVALERCRVFDAAGAHRAMAIETTQFVGEVHAPLNDRILGKLQS